MFQILPRSHAVLAKEYRKALKDRLSPPCAKPYQKLLHPASVAEAEAGRDDKLICYACGAMEIPFGRFMLGVLLGEGAICATYIFAGQALLDLL